MRTIVRRGTAQCSSSYSHLLRPIRSTGASKPCETLIQLAGIGYQRGFPRTGSDRLQKGTVGGLITCEPLLHKRRSASGGHCVSYRVGRRVDR